jgi:hypothetical protein
LTPAEPGMSAALRAATLARICRCARGRLKCRPFAVIRWCADVGR